jgi:hypothetical protein
LPPAWTRAASAILLTCRPADPDGEVPDVDPPATLDVARPDDAGAAQLEDEPGRHARQCRRLPKTQVVAHGAKVGLTVTGPSPERHRERLPAAGGG